MPRRFGPLLASLAAVVALTAITGCGDSPDDPSPPPAPPAGAPPAAPSTSGGPGDPDQQRLLATIPEATRSSCITSPVALREGQLAQVSSQSRMGLRPTGKRELLRFAPRIPYQRDLSAGAGHTVYYTLFADSESMDALYRFAVASAGATADQGACSASPPGEQPRGDRTGRLTCATQGVAAIAWTHDPLLVLGEAMRGDGDLAALYQWYSGPDSGPTR